MIPEGIFLTGCNPTPVPWDLEPCSEDEVTLYEVHLDEYYIDRYEVSQAQWQLCFEAGVCPAPLWFGFQNEYNPYLPEETPKRPVTLINWFEARDYCTFAGKRLCTEHEWEKAARGTDGRRHPWSEHDVFDCQHVNAGLPARWMPEPCDENPLDVDTLPGGASPYGLLHALGNAGEIVVNRDFDGNPLDAVPDECNSAIQAPAAARGGSWSSKVPWLSTWWRLPYAESSSGGTFGVRCCRDAAGHG